MSTDRPAACCLFWSCVCLCPRPPFLVFVCVTKIPAMTGEALLDSGVTVLIKVHLTWVNRSYWWRGRGGRERGGMGGREGETDRQTDRWTDGRTDKEGDRERQTDRNRDRNRETVKERQTDRQTETETDRQIDREQKYFAQKSNYRRKAHKALTSPSRSCFV